MNPAIFQIRHLHCAYQPGKPVLEIEALQIPRGELIFVVGMSGIGKSTFIESLGLMNNTIAAQPGTEVRFTDHQGQSTELSDVWQKDSRFASAFRNRHFSFIFQQTNLMPNFSVGENAAIGLLLQGQSMMEARRRILDLMDIFQLPAHIFDQKVFELSGGQRQRLAFLRAVTSEFEVLFGDEPTGNLDPGTSEILMQYLTKLLKKEQKTGLIVSHDLVLATQFADRIMVIRSVQDGEHRKGKMDTTGQIVQQSGQWYQLDGAPLSAPVEWLRRQMGYHPANAPLPS